MTAAALVGAAFVFLAFFIFLVVTTWERCKCRCRERKRFYRVAQLDQEEDDFNLSYTSFDKPQLEDTP